MVRSVPTEEVDRLPQASLEPSPTVTSHDFLSYIYLPSIRPYIPLTFERVRKKKKKTTKILSVLELKYIYIWWNLPSPCRLGIALLIKNRCIPARQVTRFFQAPVQKGATPRGGCHPSQLAAAQRAAAQRAAAVFVLSTWPGRCQVQPPQGWFVGSGGSWMFVVDISAVV